MLPKKDGVTLCRELRNQRITTPVLMLTARDAMPWRIGCWGWTAGQTGRLPGQAV